MDVEDKLLSFVGWQGEIPPDARRITTDEAALHCAPWVRRDPGVGSYVIGFELRDSWWALFFHRLRDISATGVEVWKVDSYNNTGRSWERRFWYWPDGRWQQVSPRDAAQCKGASPGSA